MKTLNQLFEEEAAKRGAVEDTPAEMARSKAKAEAEKIREIKQGLRDANGDWVEQINTEDEDESDEESE